MARVAVIGAGLSGLVVARQLGNDHAVTLFEKSRGPGGRMATRYAGDFEFDHGAQFFTARTAEFRTFLKPLIAAGLVRPWAARFVELDGSTVASSRAWDDAYPHFVGAPRMNVIGKHLAGDLDIRYRTAVKQLTQERGAWTLIVSDPSGVESAVSGFDWAVITVPLAQARDLAPQAADFDAAAGARSMLGCYALMLGFETRPEVGFDAALVKDADISWISVNSSKPGRGPAPTLVVHATNRWAEANMDRDLDEVLSHMVAEVSRVTGFDVSIAVHKAVHRWRFANAPKATGPAFFLDAEHKLGFAGDWWLRGRVESAFTSGWQLANAMRSF